MFFRTRQCTQVHRLGVQKRAKLEKGCVFGHITNFGKDMMDWLKKNACKNAYLGSIFIPEKYVFRVCFESPFTRMISNLKYKWPPRAITVKADLEFSTGSSLLYQSYLQTFSGNSSSREVVSGNNVFHKTMLKSFLLWLFTFNNFDMACMHAFRLDVNSITPASRGLAHFHGKYMRVAV